MTAASTRPTTVVVDLDAIRANVATLRQTIEPALLCVVVKADGYGHGAVEVAHAAKAAGAAAFAVAVVEEGIVLRRSGIDDPILVLAEVPAAGLEAALADDLSLTVGTAEAIAAASDAARDLGAVARLHLKVDTGMHRIGAAPDEVVALARRIVDDPALRLEAVWTHLAVADEPERPDTKEQEERFAAVEARLAAAGIDVPMVHLANSAGLDRAPDGPARPRPMRRRRLRARSVGRARRTCAADPGHVRTVRDRRRATGRGGGGHQLRPPVRDDPSDHDRNGAHRLRRRGAAPSGRGRRRGARRWSPSPDRRDDHDGPVDGRLR